MSADRRPTQLRIALPVPSLCLVAVVSIVAFAAPSVAQADRSPVARHPGAYRDQPPLAYVSDGHVFVLDGKGHSPRAIVGATGACCVGWAPDGTRLAFQRGADLWVTQADGSETRRIARRVQRWAWAPDGEAMAVIPKPGRAGGATGIDFYAIERSHARVTLLRTYRVLDLAWAGLGRRVAVSAVPAAGTGRAALFMLEVAGPYGDCAALCPEPVQPVVIDPSAAGVYLAGWSPTVSTLAVWTGPLNAGSGRSLLELSLLSPAGGTTTPIANTLMNRSWIRWAPAGDQLLVVQGGGQAGATHVLALCAPPLGCRALNGPATSVVDPAWSAAGRIASVVTPVVAGGTSTEAGGSEPPRGLSVTDRDGGAARVVAAGAVSAPHWLPDTRHLVFVRDRTLWLLDADRGAAVAIAGPLGNAIGGPVSEAPGSSTSLEEGDQLFSVAP